MLKILLFLSDILPLLRFGLFFASKDRLLALATSGSSVFPLDFVVPLTLALVVASALSTGPSPELSLEKAGPNFTVVAVFLIILGGLV